MTKQTQRLQDFPFHLTTLGLEPLFAYLDKQNNRHNNGATKYPPYNLIKIEDGDKPLAYRIEMAVAGFKKEQISIKLDKNKLIIEGNGLDTQDYTGLEFLHKGISTKYFSQEFIIGETIQLTNAEMIEGLLVISFEEVIPEELKVKEIAIQ